MFKALCTRIYNFFFPKKPEKTILQKITENTYLTGNGLVIKVKGELPEYLKKEVCIKCIR